VIVSVNRVADQLEREPGREEDSKFLREYFTQAPIQNAIQAAAVHRSTHKEVISFLFAGDHSITLVACFAAADHFDTVGDDQRRFEDSEIAQSRRQLFGED
jgi:hypothetical protein